MTGVASGFITSAPVRVLHMIGSRLATMVATVITFGPQPQARAVLDACKQIVASEGRAALGLRLLHGFLEIDDHDDAGLDGGAEERDVADPHGDAEIVAEQLLQKDAAASARTAPRG